MVVYDEIELSYDGRIYDFQKASVADRDNLIVLSFWEAGDMPRCCFLEEVVDGNDREAEIVDWLLSENVLYDNTSIAESENRIAVEFFT